VDHYCVRAIVHWRRAGILYAGQARREEPARIAVLNKPKKTDKSALPAEGGAIILLMH